MKNLFKNLMLVAVAAMAFVACNSDLVSVDVLKKPTVITFNASMEDDTRTSMTDENSDGKYEVNWSAGDQVAFVVYGDNDSIIEIQTATVAEAGASAELTVEFTSELTTGQRIVAYCNYNCGYDGYWGTYYFYQPSHDYQYPKQNDVEKHYISAEYTYNGEAVAPLKFSHDYAYAKMVVEGLEEGIDRIEMTFNDTKTINLNCYDVTNNIYMFTCPAMEVNKINVEVTTNKYDENYQPVCYTFNKELAAGKLTFKNGSIAKFTIKDWQSILASPYVQATEIKPNSITFSWEAVEGAKDYTYTCNGTTGTTEETSVVVSGLEPLTKYSFTIVANPKNSDSHATSKESYAEATTGADRSTLDELFTEVVEFANMTKLENYTNTYLFTTDGGGTTINDKFMYLRFNNEIDFSKSGEYSIDDLYSEYGECCIWIGHAVDGCNGYGNGYNLGFTPYHFFNNSGDTYIIYVDVVDGKSSITVYANNASWWSALKFKGVYVEKSILATPVVTATAERNTITATWEAIEGAANYTVTCGNESKTIEGTTATFEGLEYATEYTVSVVANPADTTNYKASLAGEATATTVTLTTLDTPNATASVEGNVVTISWDAVEGAGSYTVTFNGVSQDTTNTEIVFTDLEYNNEYNYYIVANPENENTHKASYPEYGYVTTERDPNAGYSYDLTFATCEAGAGNTYTFTTDDGSYEWKLKLQNKLAVGSFVNEQWNNAYWVGNDTKFSYPGMPYPAYIQNGTLDISLDGEIYTITLVSYDVFENGVKFTYTGAIEEYVSTGIDLSGYTELKDVTVTWSGSSVVFRSSLPHSFYMNLYGVNGTLTEGLYTATSYPSYDSGTLEGFNVGEDRVANIYLNDDGSYTITAESTYDTIGMQKVYFTITL